MMLFSPLVCVLSARRCADYDDGDDGDDSDDDDVDYGYYSLTIKKAPQRKTNKQKSGEDSYI